MMSTMRTTLTLNDPLNGELRKFAADHTESFRDAVNAVLRAGLTALKHDAADTVPFEVVPHRGGFRPGVDPEKLNQTLDELEIDAFARGKHA